MANATILYACTESGLVVINKPGTLNEWLPPRKAFDDRAVVSVWAEPGPPITVMAVAGGELLLSRNGGRTWDSVEITPGATPPEVTSISQAGEPPVLYAGLRDGLAISDDEGATWRAISLPAASGSVRAVVAGPQGEGVVYLLASSGGTGALLAGNPSGGVWRTLLTGATAVYLDQANGNLFATTAQGVLVLVKGSTDWSPMLGSPQDGREIVAIPGPAGKPTSLVVGASSGLWVCPSGDAWRSVNQGTPGGVAALARDPERRDRLYAAVDGGYLYESGNRGESWQALNAEHLPAVSYIYVVRF